MYILLQLFVIISEMACVPILYSLISGKEFNILTYISIILGNFIIGILLMSIPENFINYLIHPIYFIVISWILGKEGSTTLKIFYALFPITLINILHRLIGIFILPLFGVSVNILNASLLGNRLLSIFTSVIAFVFLKGNQYQFHSLADQSINYKDKRILVITNVSMVLYYIILQLLAYIEYTKFTTTLFVREALVIIYLVFFLIITNRLDLHLRERIQSDLMLQKDLQLKNLENYSHHIEELYTEVRSFRHDYANILTTLKLGIEQNDIGIVKNVYHSVLKDSNKRFRNPKYDIGRLVHIKNDALKSLLAAKFAQAQEHNVSVSLEVPEDICPQGMELVDFITIVSILCDNAIEAAAPTMTIAYVLSGNKQVFSIENAIKEEHIDMSYIFDAGVSSKGSGRGIGLSNVLAILDRYPNVSLASTSQNHCFQHILEIHLN